MDYDNDNILLLAAMISGESISEDYDTMHMVGSSAINRANANRPDEFGSSLPEILQKGYYAVQNQNTPYTQAVTQSFPDKKSEDKYKQALAIASGLYKGTIKPREGMFYFTDDEIKKLKRKKSFNFKAVKEHGKVGKYTVFSY